ncbi:MAG: sulfatase [Planctomycetota bacterium]
MKLLRYWIWLVLTIPGAEANARPDQEPALRANVVLIVCDDLNDWIEPLGEHPQAHTPSLAEFARTAVTFENAHSNNPVCAPSRASMLSGLYPHRSGNLFWAPWHQNPVLADSKTIMRYFREHGYRVVGSGKLMHHFKRDEWDEFPHKADYGPIAWDGTQRVGHPTVAEPFRSIGPIDGSFGRLSDVPFEGREGAGWIRGGWGPISRFRYTGPEDRDLTPDERVARWASRRIERFSEEDGEPFFMGIGFIRPHTPMYAPDRFFDLFPIDDIQLSIAGGEPSAYLAHVLPDQKGRRYHRLIAEAYGSERAGLARFAQAYLASTAFVDEQIGVVLDALERTGLDENTIVIITSDHGFVIGEQHYLFKNAPWDASTRVPLLIRAPGVSKAGARSMAPVGLIDLYPTLIDLCGLTGDTRSGPRGRPLDGHSLRPLLTNPEAEDPARPPAVLTMVHAEEDASRPLDAQQANDPAYQHWSIRTADYRYIRYNSGAVELFDLTAHRGNSENLARHPEHQATLVNLDAMLRGMAEPIGLQPLDVRVPAPRSSTTK